MPNLIPPVYACGYTDQKTDLPADGCVPVPAGPALGVSYDWAWIEANAVDRRDWRLPCFGKGIRRFCPVRISMIALA